MAKDPTIGLYLVTRWNCLKAERAAWDSKWEEIARYVIPRKGGVISQTNTPQIDPNLYDTTGVFANTTLANGMLSYMTPADGRWFAYKAPKHKRKDDKVNAWYQECTEIAQEVIANSNFNSEIHELYFDDGAFGTSVIYVKESKSSVIYFDTIKCGQYCLAEDNEGNVDTLFRELLLDVRQAAKEFGEDNLSAELKKELKEYKEQGKGGEAKHSILHAIYPRDDSEREPGKMDGPNMPYASVYVETKTKHVIKTGGFPEKPFSACRHDKYSGEVYGSSPSWRALPDIRQLNFLVKTMDAMAEIKAFPRTLIPDNLEGSVDMRAGGETYFDPSNPNAIPKEWGTNGEYNVGLEREKRKQDSVERHYYVDMFRMFSSLDKQMTAREVAERSAEKLNQFTPAFARKTTELYGPTLKRVFAILLRGGYFPAPPLEVFDAKPDGSMSLTVPEVMYNSRIALAMQALQNIALHRTVEGIMPIAGIKEDVLDNFEWDVIARESARNDGMPSDWITTTEKVQDIRSARAEAQQQQQQAEQAALLAKAAGDVGKIPPGSPVAKLLPE